MAHQQPLELKKPHHPKEQEQQEEDDSDKDDTFAQTPSASKPQLCNNNVEMAMKELVLPPPSLDVITTAEGSSVVVDEGEVASGRERLKKHRVEVAGRVWIPEKWGQEELLKDWIDCTAFDAPLVPSKIVTARTALVKEGGRRASTGDLRIEYRC